MRKFGIMKAQALVTLALCGLLLQAGAMYDSTDAVEELTGDNFEEEVKSSEDFWMVEFYAPWCGHCQKLAPEWKKAAKELEGAARLGAVDCDDDDNKGLCSEYGIKGFPTIKVFGEDKKSPTDYQQARSADAIVSFVKETQGPGLASSKLVTPLKYLDTYFFLHEDNSPKVILLTKGEPKAPSWVSSLAVKYKEGKVRSVKFAHADLDSQPQIFKNLKIEPTAKFPLLVLARITGTWKEGRGFFSTFEELKGLKGSDALKAAKEAVDEMALGEEFDVEALTPLPAFPPPESPKKLAPTSFHMLTADNADTHCFGGSKAICVLALIKPASKGSEDFPEKETLISLSRKYRNDPFSFAWADVTNQAEFVAGFGLDAEAAAPALLVIKHGKRNRFAVHEGPIEPKAVSDLLDRTLGGDVTFKNLKPVPELVPAYLQDTDEEVDEQ